MCQESVAALFVTCSFFLTREHIHTGRSKPPARAGSKGPCPRACSSPSADFSGRMSVCMSREAVSGAWGSTIAWCRLLLCVASPVLPAATPVLSSAWLMDAGLRIVRSILVPTLPVPNGTMLFFDAHWCSKADFSQYGWLDSHYPISSCPISVFSFLNYRSSRVGISAGNKIV